MPHPAHPRVLQVITHLDMGGAENVAISLAEALHPEFSFSFFAVGGVVDNPVGQEMARRLKRLHVPVHSGTALGFKRGGLAQAGVRLNRLIWKTRPEIVHLHTEIPETTFAVASLLGLPAGTRIVRTVHNSEIWPAWQRVGRLVEPRLRRATVVGVSAACLDGLWEFQAGQHLPLTPRDQMRVVYNGVSAPPDAAPEQALRPADHPIRVLFAGRLEPQKGVDLLPELLTAASALTARPVEVTILGHGSLEKTLKQWVHTQTLPWSVTLAEPVANLAAHLGNYDLMLVPSRFEGLGLVAVEALMAGVPVVATRVRGLSEIFPSGYPLLCPSGDVPALARTLAEAIGAYEHYAGVAAAQQPEIFQRFNLEGMAQGYRCCYLGALQGSQKERSVQRKRSDLKKRSGRETEGS
ncbi:glycosyltransferase [Deinococcus marmoris]|uniref:glycosyltransferase n=1 Tax=Deinococcus marmoris TaxID=249408 RepID=UPI00068ED5D0|nr:glycosyltransferase [Deinococcus marmoris]